MKHLQPIISIAVSLLGIAESSQAKSSSLSAAEEKLISEITSSIIDAPDCTSPLSAPDCAWEI